RRVQPQQAQRRQTLRHAHRIALQARLGEAVLQALDRVTAGLQGDPMGVTQGLSALRLLGLDAPARRLALELMLLERRG
ncbi:MAG: hypothetical protein IE927_15200, partial [Rhodobacterales bacterium]|nr:hypothetical protein [Rhodobacterales bacterium]